MMAKTTHSYSDDNRWVNLKLAFNRVGEAYFDRLWHKDTILLSPGRFREKMDPKQLPQKVDWPVQNPMRPAEWKMDLQFLYSSTPYPAPEIMVRNYEFVKKNLLLAIDQGLLKIDITGTLETWSPKKLNTKVGLTSEEKLSYEDSEYFVVKTGRGKWVEARLERSGLQAFVEMIEAETENRKNPNVKNTDVIAQPDTNQSLPVQNSGVSTNDPSPQDLVNVMLLAFQEMRALISEHHQFLATIDQSKDQPSKKGQKASSAKFPSPPNLCWEEITIIFYQNDAVKIKAQDIEGKYTFSELGFKDGRKGDAPNSGWNLLREGFAAHHGQITWEKSISDDIRKNLTKSVSEITKPLKQFFGLSESPMHRYRPDRGYKLKLDIRDHRFVEYQEPQTLVSGSEGSIYKQAVNEEMKSWLDESSGVKRIQAISN
jgi:hypothetical protein